MKVFRLPPRAFQTFMYMKTEVVDDDDDVVVDDGDGDGNDEMSTNSKRNGRDTETAREWEKEMCVHNYEMLAHVYPDTVSVSE